MVIEPVMVILVDFLGESDSRDSQSWLFGGLAMAVAIGSNGVRTL
jgi:hypothetical protein